jgi:hypothetical protein
VNMQMYMDAAVAAERAKFLFDEDINRYLEQLLKDLGNLESLGSEQNIVEGVALEKNLNSQQQIKDRITLFYKDGTARFAPYIRFDHKLR